MRDQLDHHLRWAIFLTIFFRKNSFKDFARFYIERNSFSSADCLLQKRWLCWILWLFSFVKIALTWTNLFIINLTYFCWEHRDLSNRVGLCLGESPVRSEPDRVSDRGEAARNFRNFRQNRSSQENQRLRLRSLRGQTAGHRRPESSQQVRLKTL